MPSVHEPTAHAAGSTGPYAPHHFELLERTLTVALSATEYPDSSSWGAALTQALCALTGVEAGAILLPGDGERWRPVTRNAAHTPASGIIHEEATERLLRSSDADLVVWVRDDLAVADRPSAPVASTGTIGLRVRVGNDVAAICLLRDPALGPLAQNVSAALRAIAPAFRAGVAAWVAASKPNATVARMLDSLADPAMMFDLGGALLHANPSVERLMSNADTSRLREEAQCMAWKIGAVARRRTVSRASSTRLDSAGESPTVRRVRIAGSVYQLRASMVGEQLLGNAPAILVTITAATSEPLSDDALQNDFGLTAREVQVARLIAQGLSNSEIATRLGVKFFTARNHVERTLAKLGVPSRTRVGPLLRNEAVEDRAA
jgi:DNA-binding CsgD family transcriptional regulator